MRHDEELRKMMTGPLQKRICSVDVPLPQSADQVMARLRGMLRKAKVAGLLRNSLQDVSYGLIKMDAPITEKLYRQERLDEKQYPRDRVVAIFGGEKNFHRLRSIPHFERDDGAWFDFTITVFEEGPRRLELLSYDFEIRFPQGDPVGFLRFDLNGPANPRKDGMRCHVHPNSDDDERSLPAPVLSPEEMLKFLIHGLRAPEKSRQRKGEDFRMGCRVEALCDAALTVMRARGLGVTREQEERLQACTDIGLLSCWLERAATVQIVAEIFEER